MFFSYFILLTSYFVEVPRPYAITHDPYRTPCSVHS